MNLVRRSLILSVGKPYDFIPEGQKESISGCKMYYVGCDDIMKKEISEEDETLGYFPQKVTMPPNFYQTAKAFGLPCYADITYSIKLTSKGTDVDIMSVEFVKK